MPDADSCQPLIPTPERLSNINREIQDAMSDRDTTRVRQLMAERDGTPLESLQPVSGTQQPTSNNQAQPFNENQSDGAPSKRARHEERLPCVPVMLRMLEDALANSGSGTEVQVHGSESGMLLIVGVIEALSKQPMCLDFSLNDGSGRMKARYFTNDAQLKDLAGVAPGRYVNVVGSIRTCPEVHVSVMFMRLIHSPDEVSHHLIEAAYAALKLTRDGLDPARSHRSIATPCRSPEKDAAGLQIAVLEYIRTQGEGKEEGVSLADVTQHLQPKPAAEVKSLLLKLVDEGDLYTTMDDAHFRAL